MYKDVDKQKQAAKEAKARWKARRQGIPVEEGIPLGIPQFKDLPLDVQRTINRLSDTEQEHGIRTSIAIDYQRQFPGRYYNTGVALSAHKFGDVVYVGSAAIFNEGKRPHYV